MDFFIFFYSVTSSFHYKCLSGSKHPKMHISLPDGCGTGILVFVLWAVRAVIFFPRVLNSCQNYLKQINKQFLFARLLLYYTGPVATF